ncbi:MAG: hypothetical protein D6734_10015 [Candidatus Schekmanbacteria bacterium]|nr:MAG: hypothetical protein D6734_10015 [Candidatus Schekmanbacteria bacterium]
MATNIDKTLVKFFSNRLKEDIKSLQAERRTANANKSLKNLPPKEALKEFESLFVFYMLKEMTKNNTSQGLFGKGFGNEYFTDMFNQEVARALSKGGGIGIADFIEKNSKLKIIKKDNRNRIENFLPSQQHKHSKEKEKVSISKIVQGGRISSPFGVRNDPFTGEKRFHDGIDIACAEGTKVYPIMSGKVIFSGEMRGYGNVVIIEHNNGIQSYYAHNKVNFVKKGDLITTNTPIALSGKTGRATGPHLHFELRADNKPQNPEKYLKI